MAHFNRREIATVSLAAGLASLSTPTLAAKGSGISHRSAAIHQEVIFHAPAARVYQTLTTTALFDRVVQLSAAVSTGMVKNLAAAPTAIDAQPGGAFSLFGGYVTGRSLELVANTRLVQAWRAGSWDAGLFSIAHFALEDHGETTRIIFDHRGFPDAEAAHLSEGWHINYWQPMAKSFA